MEEVGEAAEGAGQRRERPEWGSGAQCSLRVLTGAWR